MNFHPNPSAIGKNSFKPQIRLKSQCHKDSRRSNSSNNKLAYLESSNPRNITLYKRHGFELLGTIQIGTSPSIAPMLRRPR
jgi:hypothetical protein